MDKVTIDSKRRLQKLVLMHPNNYWPSQGLAGCSSPYIVQVGAEQHVSFGLFSFHLISMIFKF